MSLNRQMPRWMWKWWYRQQRIMRREADKAFCDALIYGVGCIRISDEGFVNHIRPEAVSERHQQGEAYFSIGLLASPPKKKPSGDDLFPPPRFEHAPRR